jgi:hypothetical protein
MMAGAVQVQLRSDKNRSLNMLDAYHENPGAKINVQWIHTFDEALGNRGSRNEWAGATNL